MVGSTGAAPYSALIGGRVGSGSGVVAGAGGLGRVVVAVLVAVGCGWGRRAVGSTGAGPYTGTGVVAGGASFDVVVVSPEVASLVGISRAVGSTGGGPYTATGPGSLHPAIASPAPIASAANVSAPFECPQCGHEVSAARTWRWQRGHGTRGRIGRTYAKRRAK